MGGLHGGRHRLAVDIGGTFTDVALAVADGHVTAKVLTTSENPSRGVLDGVHQVLDASGVRAADIGLVIHGTTLATNALIERRGAKTALLTTEGHRDAVEIAYENRFEQYDINIDRPAPLVPRYLRLPVRERLDKNGQVLVPLDENSVADAIALLEEEAVESVAIGLIHGYANPEHEIRIAELVSAALPGVSVTLASRVCPEIREYERLSTACANAYVRPLMASYLDSLASMLSGEGFGCPFLLMTSGGGLTTLETALAAPIRLVESGPAGGAILARRVAQECDLARVVSYDMGGTTAKLCLLDDARPVMSRTFEVGRVYRFRKGSGLPVRVPVIEMVEIGAGGGSTATVDRLQRIQVGPESAGSAPGPACYGRGGERAAVTDADALLGRLPADRFAGGSLTLDLEAAGRAVDKYVANPLGLDRNSASYGISEIVDENMAAATRSHALEWGRDARGRTLIAFGGAAPLHAARMADKLGIDEIVVPAGAGVGSAIGFLIAPVSYEVVRSRHMRLSAFNADVVNALMDDMESEARPIVEQGAPGEPLAGMRRAFMRYVGQGYEIAVELPSTGFGARGRDELTTLFEAAYERLYGRTIPNLDIEILSWTFTLSTVDPEFAALDDQPDDREAIAVSSEQVFEPGVGARIDVPVYAREALRPGARFDGPALICEDQTTTVVTSAFSVRVNSRGYLLLSRKEVS